LWASLAGTENRELAEQLVDYILSQPFQEDMPLNMFVYPANETAEMPAEFVAWTQVPEETAVIDPQTIDANRETWIEAWTEVVLR
jgi:thiamine transport system substrate-binding protein